MLRFLQKPGPIKKYVLGGILLVVCVTMVTYLIPGGLGEYLGSGLTTQGVLAKVGDQEIRHSGSSLASPSDRKAAVQGHQSLRS